MNRKRGRLVCKWFALVGILATVIALDQSGHDSWIKPVLLICMLPVLLFERPDPEGSSRFERVAQEHRWVIWWMGLCTASFVAIALINAYSGARIFDSVSFSTLLALVGLVIIPLAVLGEYDKFEHAADAEAD